MRSTLIGLVAVSLAAVACGGDRTSLPVAPSSPTSPIVLVGTPGGSFVISGRVVERTTRGTQPLPDTWVNLWVDQGRSGYSYWWWSGKQYRSDDAGNFQFDRLPVSTAWLQAGKTGYVQQCALPAISLGSDASNLEVTLVPREQASVDVSSVPASVAGRIVAGRIVEKTADGVQPVAGAFVDFEPVMDYPAATTYSDANGRYLLCGLSEGQIGVGASGNRVTYVSVPRGLAVDNFDIVLP